MTLYSKAISLAPGIATYYTNRAAAWMHCGAYHEAVGTHTYGTCMPVCRPLPNCDISQFSADISQFSTDISQFSTDKPHTCGESVIYSDVDTIT